MDKLEIIKVCICMIFCVCITITDIRESKIKNDVVLPAIVIGIIIGAFENNLFSSLIGMLIPLVLCPFFFLRMLGAGDIKALCAIGAVVGSNRIINVLYCVFLAGGVIAILMLIFRDDFIKRFKYFYFYILQLIASKKFISYEYGDKKDAVFNFSYAITGGYIVSEIWYLLT